jgi:hypothetical protein
MLFWILCLPPSSGPDVIMTSLCRHNWTMETQTVSKTEVHTDFNALTMKGSNHMQQGDNAA